MLSIRISLPSLPSLKEKASEVFDSFVEKSKDLAQLISNIDADSDQISMRALALLRTAVANAGIRACDSLATNPTTRKVTAVAKMFAGIRPCDPLLVTTSTTQKVAAVAKVFGWAWMITDVAKVIFPPKAPVYPRDEAKRDTMLKQLADQIKPAQTALQAALEAEAETITVKLKDSKESTQLNHKALNDTRRAVSNVIAEAISAILGRKVTITNLDTCFPTYANMHEFLTMLYSHLETITSPRMESFPTPSQTIENIKKTLDNLIKMYAIKTQDGRLSKEGSALIGDLKLVLENPNKSDKIVRNLMKKLQTHRKAVLKEHLKKTQKGFFTRWIQPTTDSWKARFITPLYGETPEPLARTFSAYRAFRDQNVALKKLAPSPRTASDDLMRNTFPPEWDIS